MKTIRACYDLGLFCNWFVIYHHNCAVTVGNQRSKTTTN